MKNNYRLCHVVRLSIFIVGVWTANPARAQETGFKKISGTVTDSNNLPIPGVNILVKGEDIGTSTDFDGAYSLQVKPEDTLVFSYLGYTTIQEVVGARSRIMVQLQENADALGEVVINAGYYSVRERERTGSIGSIGAEAIEQQPVSNPLAVMQGRIPGVHVVQNSGVPGGGFDIQIRGINSLRTGGNEPMYIIDGVPYSSESMGDFSVSTSILPGVVSPLNSINPNDIERIEVLKGADATAIYGSRGANGVVLISTKRARAGETQINIDASTGVGRVTNMMELMNTQQYLAMRREAFENDDITEYPPNAYDLNGTWDEDRYTDWQEELIGGTANIHNVHASISGGSEQTQFMLGGGYMSEGSVFPGDYRYQKGSARVFINHGGADEKFRVQFSANYVSDHNNLVGTDLSGEAVFLAPNAPALYDDEGNLNWEDGTFNNPLRYLETAYEARTKNLIANAVLSYDILPSLQLKSSLGYNETRLDESKTNPSTIYNPAYGIGSENSYVFVNDGLRSSWIVEPQLHWKQTYGKAGLDFLVGATFQEQRGERLSRFAQGFASNELIQDLGSASVISILNSGNTTYKYQAIFGRFNFNWEGKYIVNITGRRDGSSRFGPDKQFANFGAIGVAWIFTREPWISEHIDFLNFGKIRSSYGLTGNDQIGDYQFLDTYSVTGNVYDGTIGLAPSRLYNPDFGWETNKKFEVALELGFWEDALYLSSTYYRNRSSNQLVGIPLPGITGFSSLQANLDATVENTGYEFEISSRIFRKGAFQWTSSVNLSLPRNELVSFPDLEGSTYANEYVIGEPIDIIKLYQSNGINPETGLYQFEDFNEDGVIDSEDRQVVKSLSPDYFGGWSNSFSYRNWEFDILFQFVKQEGYNFLYTGSQPGYMSNQPVEVLNHYPEDGVGALIQQYSAGMNPDAYAAYELHNSSDAIISDASYIRLKNIALSYRFPEQWSKLGSMKIYLQGQNLLTFSNYMGADPESQSLGSIPPLKVITAGVQLNF